MSSNNWTKFKHDDNTPMGKVFTAERRSGFNPSADENKEHCINSVIRAMPWAEGTPAEEKRNVAKQFIRDYYPHGVHRSRLPLMATIEVARYMVEFAKTHPVDAAPAEELAPLPVVAAPAVELAPPPAVEIPAAPVVVAAPAVELAASAPIFMPSPAPRPTISAETLAVAARTFPMISPEQISQMAASACAAAACAPAYMPPAHYGGHPAFMMPPAHYGGHPAYMMPAGYYGGRF